MRLAKFLSRFNVTRVQANEWRRRTVMDEDFSAQSLEHLRLLDCRFVRCRFDGAKLGDLRVWNSTFEDCSFNSCDLRGAVLGAVDHDQCNVFEGVDFSRADLRESVHVSAEFSGCRFDGAELSRVEFNGSRFSKCHFSGQLRDTAFSDVAFGYGHLAPNRMAAVDFRSADLSWVMFRRLDLSACALPDDEWHVILQRFRHFLTVAVKELSGIEGRAQEELRSMLEIFLRDSTEGVGVLNRRNFYGLSRECGLLFDETVATVV